MAGFLTEIKNRLTNFGSSSTANFLWDPTIMGAMVMQDFQPMDISGYHMSGRLSTNFYNYTENMDSYYKCITFNNNTNGSYGQIAKNCGMLGGNVGVDFMLNFKAICRFKPIIIGNYGGSWCTDTQVGQVPALKVIGDIQYTNYTSLCANITWYVVLCTWNYGNSYDTYYKVLCEPKFNGYNLGLGIAMLASNMSSRSITVRLFFLYHYAGGKNDTSSGVTILGNYYSVSCSWNSGNTVTYWYKIGSFTSVAGTTDIYICNLASYQ